MILGSAFTEKLFEFLTKIVLSVDHLGEYCDRIKSECGRGLLFMYIFFNFFISAIFRV